MSNKPKRGFSIRIFLPDGSPTGLRVVEKSNWTGRGIVCPRPQFTQAKTRPEFGKAGVYVLAGVPTETGITIYIGEGDPIRPRLEQHGIKKDFWEVLFAFTSKDENLNKAHVQYLESRLIEIAREAKRCELDNGNFPARPSLSEADQAEVEAFLDEMLLCFPVLGLSVFEKPPARQIEQKLLFLQVKGITATGYESTDGLVVTKGSQAVTEERPSIHRYQSSLRKKMLERGVLIPDNDRLILTQDYVFDSPSTAAAVLLGRPSNGRTAWKDEHGRSLKDLQQQSSEESFPEDASE